MGDDAVERFVEQCCTQGPSAREPTLRLWDGYLRWCTGQRSLAAQEFLVQLRKLGLKVRGGYVLGVKLNAMARVGEGVEAPASKDDQKDDRQHGLSLVRTTQKVIQDASVTMDRTEALIEDIGVTIARSAVLLEESVLAFEEGLFERSRHAVMGR